jgi:cold shock protein
MTVSGTGVGVVLTWDGNAGWGVIESAQTPGGCWCHFSCLAVDGYAWLGVGTAVEFLFEPGPQDGYAYRAVQAWPRGQRVPHPDPERAGGAYASALVIEMDDPGGSD